MQTEDNPQAEDNPVDSGIDKVLDEVLGDAPEPSEHAVRAFEAEQERTEQANTTSNTDSAGVIFNPEIHAVDADGKPKLTKAGRFAKRRGRKPGADKPSRESYIKRPGGSSVSPKVSPGELTEADIQKARQMGVGMANMLFAAGRALGGEEWEPRVDAATGVNERLHVESAFADYFVATGKTDIPPGMALALAIGAYALPRLTAGPKTQSRLKAIGAKIAGWWHSRKAKGKGKTSGTLFNSGNDGKRENEPSEETSAKATS